MEFSLKSVLYMLITVIGGSALTYYISGRTLKPLDILNGQVKNMTVHNLIGVINNKTFRPRKLVGTLLDMTNMGDKDVKITLSAEAGTIIGNIDLLYHAFYNLIENSIKYNIDGRKVLIVVRKSEQEQTTRMVVLVFKSI